MSKNAYEIRMELLHLAKEILDARREYRRDEFNNLTEEPRPNYTDEDVIKVARRLKEFVDDDQESGIPADEIPINYRGRVL